MTLRPYRRFRDILGLLSRGRLEEKLDEHFVHAIETLQALPQGRSGKATITLAIEIAYENERLDIKPALKSKLPEDKAFTGTPFWAVDGGASVQHPDQFDMLDGPRAVPRPVPMPNETR